MLELVRDEVELVFRLLELVAGDMGSEHMSIEVLTDGIEIARVPEKMGRLGGTW